MSKTYHFAIDETGQFNFSKDDKSFVCGVFVSEEEKKVIARYKEAYVKFGLGAGVPEKVADLIGKDANGRPIFHFSGMPNDRKEVCRELLLPLAEKIFVSKGKPLLWANNQNFWFIAVASVILELFKTQKFQKGDRLHIDIDNRADKVWGIPADNGETKLDFNKYHHYLKSQIDKLIESHRARQGIEVKVKFVGDTESFFVSLADIVCGLVRKDENGSIPKIECRCESVMNGDNPVSIIDKNPIGALNAILTQILNDELQNVGLLPDVFKKTRSNSEDYAMVWDTFHNFAQYHLKTRYASKNTIAQLSDIMDEFLTEFKKFANKITVDKRLDIVNTFMAYYSHKGEIKVPIEQDYFIKLLNETDKNAETRITRKWEKYTGYYARKAQILFNAYNFSEAIENYEKIWEIQEKILNIDYPFKPVEDKAMKDEPTTAIIGTLAQSYAFNGDIDKAIEYFEMALEYAVKTPAQTASYLVTLYFIKKDIENVRKYFELQTGKTPEEFADQQSFEVWGHLSYSKLRALELYKTQKSNLAEIDITNDYFDKEYPFPLILKWCAVAKYLENQTENNQLISKYLECAIKNLLNNEKSDFTITTLALPIIQIYALIDNTNQYHGKYDKIVEELKKMSSHFKDYVEKKMPTLNQIKNNAKIWERAMGLPFNYS